MIQPVTCNYMRDCHIKKKNSDLKGIVKNKTNQTNPNNNNNNNNNKTTTSEPHVARSKKSDNQGSRIKSYE